jgi:hypothetical protein
VIIDKAESLVNSMEKIYRIRDVSMSYAPVQIYECQYSLVHLNVEI